MTSAKSSFGTLLKIGDGASSEAFTTVAEVRDIKGPALELNTEEVTSHSSTAGWEEHIATTATGGELSFELNWIPGNATQSYSAGLLKLLATTKTPWNFQLVVPAASSVTWSFAAIVTKFVPDLPVKGKQAGAVTLKLTGQPTLA